MDGRQQPPEPKIEVAHEPADRRYVLRLDGTVVGKTEYRPRPDGVMVFFHTEIDPAFEGRGLASELIGSALEDTRASGQRVVAECPFVRAHVRKHPDDYRDLVVDPRL